MEPCHHKSCSDTELPIVTDVIGRDKIRSSEMPRKEEREEGREGGREKERKEEREGGREGGRKKTHSIQTLAQNGCNRSITVTSRWWFACVAFYFIIHTHSHTHLHTSTSIP